MEFTAVEMALLIGMVGMTSYIHSKFAFKGDMDRRFDRVDREFKEVKRLLMEKR